jgi:hypothetical protein
MRQHLIRAGLAAGLIAAALSAAALFLSAPLLAQSGQPRINPEDELSPSQIAQPMPPPAAEPDAAADPAPAPPPAKHSAAKPKPATTAAAGAPPAHPPHAGNYKTVVECSGPFAKDSGMLALAVAYDSRNVTFTQETVQGSQVGVSVLFAKDPRRRLEVWWRNPNRTGTYLIDITGKSIWSGPKGVKLGLTLEQLQKLNKKAFKLTGFDDNGVSNVTDWDGGEFAALDGGCKVAVSLHANIKTADAALPAKDQYSSDDPAMRALKPTTSEILIGYQ